MNKVILVARLTKDPDSTVTPGGMTISKFTVAVDRFKEGEADFIRCVAFNKTAETINQYMQKGSQIAIEGHIQTGSYDNKEGVKVYTTDVIVDRFDFCGSKNEGTGNKTKPQELTPVVDDSEIPF